MAVTEVPTAKPSRTTVDDAVRIFLAELKETIAPSTHKKYRLLLAKFKEFSVARGYTMIDQWETSDVREFRSSWGINLPRGFRSGFVIVPKFTAT